MQDCAGVWGGDAEVVDFYFDNDEDGLGAGDPSVYCDAFVPAGWVANSDDTDDDCTSNQHDCLGICDGSAIIDDCGICDGDNADMDDCGVCFGDGVNCADCAGIPNGTYELDN